MSNNFSRTLRALRADGLAGWTAWAAAAVVLLAAWGAWFVWGRITVYAVSDSARAEVGEQVYAVDAPVDGQVVAVRSELGQEVAAGEVLIELESLDQEGLLGEERARLAGLEARREELRRQLETEQRALENSLQAAQAAIEEARSRYREAASAAELARGQENRARSLHEQQLVADEALEEAISEREQKESQAESLRLAAERLARERRSEEETRRAELDALRGEEADLTGQIEVTRATIERLDRELGKRQIRAPIGGRLASVAPLRSGSHVEEGEQLAVIVPAGRIRAVAWFLPADAVGRVRSGQTARLRLHGFPSTQYGTIPATVAVVDSEPTEGRVRVELEIAGELPPEIPLQHGMPGSVEVEVDTLSPAALVLRAVGRLLDRPATRLALARSPHHAPPARNVCPLATGRGEQSGLS